MRANDRLEALLERVLETYSLEELLEANDLTELEVLRILFEEGYVSLPEKIVL